MKCYECGEPFKFDWQERQRYYFSLFFTLTYTDFDYQYTAVCRKCRSAIPFVTPGLLKLLLHIFIPLVPALIFGGLFFLLIKKVFLLELFVILALSLILIFLIDWWLFERSVRE